MTHDEKIVEAVARAIEGQIDTIELVSASPETIRRLKATRVARAAITAYQAEAGLKIANCCNCGRIIDTREITQGGDEFGCELSDGRWVCSPECWDTVVEQLLPPAPKATP